MVVTLGRPNRDGTRLMLLAQKIDQELVREGSDLRVHSRFERSARDPGAWQRRHAPLRRDKEDSEYQGAGFAANGMPRS